MAYKDFEMVWYPISVELKAEVLRPWLRWPKFENVPTAEGLICSFLSFFPKWRLKCKHSCVFITKVPPVFRLSLKIKTCPFLMMSLMEKSLNSDYVKLSTKWWTAVFIKFTNLVWMITDQNFSDTCFSIFYPTAKGRSFSGPNIWLRPNTFWTDQIEIVLTFPIIFCNSFRSESFWVFDQQLVRNLKLVRDNPKTIFYFECIELFPHYLAHPSKRTW